MGIETLNELNADISLTQSRLFNKFFDEEIHFKLWSCVPPTMVEPKTKRIIEVPVNQMTGEFYTDQIKIQNDLFIYPGIYKVTKPNVALMEVVNFSNNPLEFYLLRPLNTQQFNTKYEEINFIWSDQEMGKVPIPLSIDHLNDEEKRKIIPLCQKFKDIFYNDKEKLTFSNQIKHEILLSDPKPVYVKQYRQPQNLKEEIKSQIEKLLDNGIIRPSFSPWSSPIWMVPKKAGPDGNKKWRLVIDFRKLNNQTIDDKYPLPNITNILDSLGKATYFSTIDLASGFHQIEISPQDIPKTGFSVESGHYEFVRMPFGLKNAPSTFQRIMDNVLGDLQGKQVLCYMDDIVVFSPNLQEHMYHLKKVFIKLRQANLKIQVEKTFFLQKEIGFLGHIVSKDGV